MELNELQKADLGRKWWPWIYTLFKLTIFYSNQVCASRSSTTWSTTCCPAYTLRSTKCWYRNRSRDGVGLWVSSALPAYLLFT
jgi:hypothetical protein